MRNSFLSTVLAFCLSAFPLKAADSMAVAFVVNPSTRIGDLGIAEVRKLFLGEKETLPNGRKAILLMAPVGTPQRLAVLQQIYKMNEKEFAKYVLHSAFTGRYSPPREVTISDMKQIVSENPAAIGYMPISEVDQAVRPVLVIH
jgi:hypothetical protein